VINREYETPSSHGQHVSGTVGGAGILILMGKGGRMYNCMDGISIHNQMAYLFM
jgi:hypothetical protein